MRVVSVRLIHWHPRTRATPGQLGMSSHENATPIRVVHNSSGHLNGPARSMGNEDTRWGRCQYSIIQIIYCLNFYVLVLLLRSLLLLKKQPFISLVYCLNVYMLVLFLRNLTADWVSLLNPLVYCSPLKTEPLSLLPSGGVVIGYLGVRVFCPRPVATVLHTLGGTSVVLGEGGGAI